MKEAEFTKGLAIANATDEAVAKFKGSEQFTNLLKKEYEAGHVVGVEDIF